MPNDPPLLELTGVTKHYPVRGSLFGRRGKTVIRAVDGVSFRVAKGETLSIVGESGCGKTTTARLILRLEQPTSGTIAFEGRPLESLDADGRRQFRSSVQAVFQDPWSSLNPRMRVGTIVAEPMVVNSGLSRADLRDRVADLLQQVGLRPDQAQLYPHQFSGGQRQRIAIARALALDPDVLVADEAVSALDVSVQAQVLELLDEIQTRLGIALLFITHDLRVAAQICDDVAVMQHGRIVEQGPAAQVLTHPQQAYTRQLLDAAPGREWDFANFRPVAAEIPASSAT